MPVSESIVLGSNFTMSSFVSEWNKVKRHLLVEGGQWLCEFFDVWAPLIEENTGVKIHNDGDGLTRLQRYCLAETCAIRLSQLK